jgi:hypothetical protein
MNDTELDEMLNQWDAPAAPASLREKVRASGPERSVKRRFAWPSWHVGKGLFAGMAAGAVLFMVVMAQAFPQSFGMGGPSPVIGYPYFVESNVTVCPDNGSSHIDAVVRSFSYKGTEIVLNEEYPALSLQEILMGFHIGIHQVLLRYVPGLVMPESAAKDAWFKAYVEAGCVDKGENPIGHETILRHATTAVQHIDPDGWRGTVWRAPDLGCFAMRYRNEMPVAGGGYRVTKERDAVRVAQRDGHPWRIE